MKLKNVYIPIYQSSVLGLFNINAVAIMQLNKWDFMSYRYHIPVTGQRPKRNEILKNVWDMNPMNGSVFFLMFA